MLPFGFIMTRRVTSETTNQYWNKSVRLLRFFYPDTKIILIDDNSDPAFLSAQDEYTADQVEIIQSEFPQRGELLPYYYLLTRQWFAHAVILHDSVFFHRRIRFEQFKGVRAIPLWHFDPDDENLPNTLRILRSLRPGRDTSTLVRQIQPRTTDVLFPITAPSSFTWKGCYGGQALVSLAFIQQLEAKYGFSQMIRAVQCRADRCCLERILGSMFCIETGPNRMPSILGDIRQYQTWGYSYEDYSRDLREHRLPRPIIKVWTGR